MNTSSNNELRLKQRLSVNLKAVVRLAGKKPQEHQCRIINLSATGCRLHFETPPAFKVGMTIDMQIFIPATSMHIPNSGEIIWMEQQLNACTVGVKFVEFFNETMMQQLTKNNPPSPHTP
jgi:hypothetical protein